MPYTAAPAAAEPEKLGYRCVVPAVEQACRVFTQLSRAPGATALVEMISADWVVAVARHEPEAGEMPGLEAELSACRRDG